MNNSLPLDAKAAQTLQGNDRGGFTIPTSGLYPYQWNWDSIFVALGFATFDEARAWQEITSLFEAQWPSGMVPHIVFRQNDPDYFPGPDAWGAHQPEVKWPTSGISQPPVAATAIRWMVDHAKDKALANEQAKCLLTPLNNWHKWYHRARDPEGLGIIAISHPWESGRDNLPDWDGPGDAIDVSGVGEYKRRDTGHVDSEMRPRKKDYDRYMALVYFGRQANWDDDTIARTNPFWVADVGITSILLRAERDLKALSEQLGYSGLTKEIDARIQRMEQNYDRLWNPEAGAYCSLDLRTGKHADAATSTSFLCFYADAGSSQNRQATAQLARDWGEKVRFMVPSFAPDHPEFDALRYWRGPVWAIVNFMVGLGFQEAGETALAARVRADTKTLIESAGFAEYYSALDGKGAGGGAFSWTAAVWLAWISTRNEQLDHVG